MAVNDLLIDIDTCSHAMRGHAQVVSVLQQTSQVAISSISVGELLLDIWIAAAALEHGLRLFSADQHFARVPGLLLLS